MIPLKTEEELVLMRKAGAILSRILKEVAGAVRPGVTTSELDGLAEKLIETQKVSPAFKGYHGYPNVLCVSVNDEVVHGIPDQRALLEGDIVSLDLGVCYRGFFSDAAVTVPVGRIAAEKRKLIETTRQALAEGIRNAKVDNRLSDISVAIQNFVESRGFSVVREFVGHGIGSRLHEEPELPNFGQPGKGPVLKNGMVLAIEPMVNAGSWEIRILENGWTAVTKDGLPSAHFEHTVAITGKGPEILTQEQA